MQRRVEQVNILIRDELANIIDREVDLPEKTFVTITRVDTSRDLRYANVFISVLGEAKEAENVKESEYVLDIIEKNIYNIQQTLNRRLRMRPVPKIKFLIDREEIKRRLPVKIMHQTLNLILQYLEEKGFIADSHKGILWVYNPSPKLKKEIEKGREI